MPSVLITGAGRGIGRGTALHLAAAGWDVYAGTRSIGDGDALVTAARGRLTPVMLDITDAAQVAALDAALPETLDAVVNNAGVVVSGPVESVDLDELRRQFEVNVVAQVAVTQAVLPRLRRSRGRVVFISSVSGRVTMPLTGPYSASKYALESLADALRLELRPWGVGVSLVEPGATETDLWTGGLEAADASAAALSSDQRLLYGDHITGMRRTIARTQKQTSPISGVVGAVDAALTAKRPRARYVVGTDARAQLMLQAALPSRAFDAAIARITGMPRRR